MRSLYLRVLSLVPEGREMIVNYTNGKTKRPDYSLTKTLQQALILSHLKKGTKLLVLH